MMRKILMMLLACALLADFRQRIPVLFEDIPAENEP